MNTWVCQYILECVDENTATVSDDFLAVVWVLSCVLFILLAAILEPKKSHSDVPTPFGIILALGAVFAAGNIFLVWSVTTIVVKFELNCLIFPGVLIFVICMMALSVFIRNKRWK